MARKKRPKTVTLCGFEFKIIYYGAGVYHVYENEVYRIIPRDHRTINPEPHNIWMFILDKTTGTYNVYYSDDFDRVDLSPTLIAFMEEKLKEFWGTGGLKYLRRRYLLTDIVEDLGDERGEGGFGSTGR